MSYAQGCHLNRSHNPCCGISAGGADPTAPLRDQRAGVSLESIPQPLLWDQRRWSRSHSPCCGISAQGRHWIQSHSPCCGIGAGGSPCCAISAQGCHLSRSHSPCCRISAGQADPTTPAVGSAQVEQIPQQLGDDRLSVRPSNGDAQVAAPRSGSRGPTVSAFLKSRAPDLLESWNREFLNRELRRL